MPKLVQIDVPDMDPGVPAPRLITDGFRTAVVYRALTGHEWDKTVAAVEFKNVHLLKFGYPNDEGVVSHPLYDYDLHVYRLYEVHDSPWIEDYVQTLHVTHSPETEFPGLRHFIWVFHEDTLELICKEFTILPQEEVLKLAALTSKWFGKVEFETIPADQVWKPWLEENDPDDVSPYR